MKILLIHPSGPPIKKENIKCFSDVWGFYLPAELKKYATVDEVVVDNSMCLRTLESWFDNLPVKQYDAVIALGLRYFSQLPKSVAQSLKQKIYPGFLCQLYDGSRLDIDGVDITFTIKHDNYKYPHDSGANRFVRHRAYNDYIGWAADQKLNYPSQDTENLRILVDHTNYGDNPVDRTADVLQQIKLLVDSDIWKSMYKSVSVRRFDSGCVVDVDLSDLSFDRYNKNKSIPYIEICKEHSKAHIFCVTHPESVGQVVIETATAGALILSPNGFIPIDRLQTVRSIEWKDSVDWAQVLSQINITESRNKALSSSWASVAKRIRSNIWIRSAIRKQQ